MSRLTMETVVSVAKFSLLLGQGFMTNRTEIRASWNGLRRPKTRLLQDPAVASKSFLSRGLSRSDSLEDQSTRSKNKREITVKELEKSIEEYLNTKVCRLF